MFFCTWNIVKPCEARWALTHRLPALQRDLYCSPSARPEPRCFLFFPTVPSGILSANPASTNPPHLRLPSRSTSLSIRLSFLQAHCPLGPSSSSYFHRASSELVQIISSWPLWLYLPGKRSLPRPSIPVPGLSRFESSLLPLPPPSIFPSGPVCSNRAGPPVSCFWNLSLIALCAVGSFSGNWWILRMCSWSPSHASHAQQPAYKSKNDTCAVNRTQPGAGIKSVVFISGLCQRQVEENNLQEDFIFTESAHVTCLRNPLFCLGPITAHDAFSFLSKSPAFPALLHSAFIWLSGHFVPPCPLTLES